VGILNRTLNGLATVCVDRTLFSPNFSGESQVSLALTIIQPSGEVHPSLAPLTIQTGQTTVTITQNGNGSGHYDFGSGNLSVTLPLHVKAVNVPTLNTVESDSSPTLSTRTSTSTPCGGDFQGSPAGSASDVTGSMTLVGTADFPITFFQNVTIQIRVAGTLAI
jgi:hypothetical protein